MPESSTPSNIGTVTSLIVYVIYGPYVLYTICNELYAILVPWIRSVYFKASTSLHSGFDMSTLIEMKSTILETVLVAIVYLLAAPYIAFSAIFGDDSDSSLKSTCAKNDTLSCPPPKPEAPVSVSLRKKSKSRAGRECYDHDISPACRSISSQHGQVPLSSTVLDCHMDSMSTHTGWNTGPAAPPSLRIQSSLSISEDSMDECTWDISPIPVSTVPSFSRVSYGIADFERDRVENAPISTSNEAISCYISEEEGERGTCSSLSSGSLGDDEEGVEARHIRPRDFTPGREDIYLPETPPRDVHPPSKPPVIPGRKSAYLSRLQHVARMKEERTSHSPRRVSRQRSRSVGDVQDDITVSSRSSIDSHMSAKTTSSTSSKSKILQRLVRHARKLKSS